MDRTRRAFLAVGLLVGFYALASGLALSLVVLPYAVSAFLHRANDLIAQAFGSHRSPVRHSFERMTDTVLFSACFFSAGALLWSALPRRDRFEAIGPRLDEAAVPKLFDAIREMAAATRQKMPDDVYLINTANANVTYRGGIMGFGSRQIMCLGLPLMLGLTVSELKAVIAHEFGHYAGSDLKLGAWTYKTRTSILRTWRALQQSIFNAMIYWYWRMWLRLTSAVSREQELRADALSARVVHPLVAASALRRSVRISRAFRAYWQYEVVPVLEFGCLPPIAAGFVEFLADPNISDTLDELATAEADAPTDDFDAHPRLADRLSALERIAVEFVPPADDSVAASLLGDPDFHARRLVAFAVGSNASARLRRVDWHQVAVDVYPRRWRSEAREAAAFLARYTTDTIPVGREGFIAAGRAVQRSADAAEELCLTTACHLFSVALAVALLDAGATPETRPGRTFVFRKGDRTMDPFSVIHARARGGLRDSDWLAHCEAFGIADRRLGLAAA